MIELFGRLTPVEFQADELEQVRGSGGGPRHLDPMGGGAAGGGIR